MDWVINVKGCRYTNQGSLYLELAELTHNPTSSGAVLSPPPQHPAFAAVDFAASLSGTCLSWNWTASSQNHRRSQMRARDWWVVPDSAIICGCFKSCMAQPKLRGHPILFAHAGLFSGKGVAPFLSNPRYAEAVVSWPCLALPCFALRETYSSSSLRVMLSWAIFIHNYAKML